VVWSRLWSVLCDLVLLVWSGSGYWFVLWAGLSWSGLGWAGLRSCGPGRGSWSGLGPDLGSGGTGSWSRGALKSYLLFASNSPNSAVFRLNPSSILVRLNCCSSNLSGSRHEEERGRTAEQGLGEEHTMLLQLMVIRVFYQATRWVRPNPVVCTDSSSSAVVSVGASDSAGDRKRGQIDGTVSARAGRVRNFSLVTDLSFLCSLTCGDGVVGGDPSSCLRGSGTRNRVDEWVTELVTDRVVDVVSRS
jgi:hypothetical protein